jgi:hypothetical protein
MEAVRDVFGGPADSRPERPQTWTSRKSDGAGCVNPTPLRPRRLNQCPNGDEGTARQHNPTPVALLWLCRHDHVVAVAPASRTRHGPRRRQSTDCVRFSSYRARTRLIASLSIQRSIPTRSTRACGWFLLGQDRAICGAACEVKRGPLSLACSPSIDADRSNNSSSSRSAYVVSAQHTHQQATTSVVNSHCYRPSSRSVKLSRLRERPVWRSLRSALASICRIRSRVTANCLPTSSSV